MFAAALAGQGIAVAGIDIADPGPAAAAVAEAGGEFTGIIADITDPDVAAIAVAEAAERLGGLDILVKLRDQRRAAVAGPVRRGPHREHRQRRGLAGPARHGRLHRLQGRCHRLQPRPGQRLGPAGITVNAITPSMIPTETAVSTGVTRDLDRVVAGQAVPRPQQPEDLVSTLLYLADPDPHSSPAPRSTWTAATPSTEVWQH